MYSCCYVDVKINDCGGRCDDLATFPNGARSRALDGNRAPTHNKQRVTRDVAKFPASHKL